MSWRTAKKWVERCRAEGPVGMVDRSARPHRQPNRTRSVWSARVVPQDRAPALKATARASRDRRPGEQIRRYEHEKPGDLIHLDVKRIDRTLDGGGWRYLGPQQGDKNRAATAVQTRSRNKDHDPKTSEHSPCTP